jgi:hypothetical protein
MSRTVLGGVGDGIGSEDDSEIVLQDEAKCCHTPNCQP